jgi:beta-glucosidase
MKNLFYIALAVGLLLPCIFTIAAAEDQNTYKQTFYKAENIYRVQNPNGGARLSYSAESGLKLLEVKDGIYTYAFKDLNRNGKLDKYEDWRLTAEERAADLASRLSIDEISGLMLYPVGEPGEKGEITEGVLARLKDLHVRFMLSNYSTKDQAIVWNNSLQLYLEKNDPYGIPMNISSDPRNTRSGGKVVVYDDSEMSGWPGNLGLAATFNPEYVLKHGQITSQEYRAFGIHTALSPQVDLATEPRWSRFSGTFGEGSKLAADMAAAYVKGFQSTWDGLGSNAVDLGWGKDSVVTMIKHFPGDGAAEGGREAHGNTGKYNVYPGNNMEEHYSVFKAAFNIESKTGGAKAVMPSYSIAIGNHGPVGDGVGSGYSKYKLTTILRGKLGYDGLVCADWDIATGKVWGVENLSTVERHLLAFKNGLNMFGGSIDTEANRDAYNLGIMTLKKYGKVLPGMPDAYAAILTSGPGSSTPEADMKALYLNNAAQCLKISFYSTLFEDPFIVEAESTKTLANNEFKEAGMDAQKASVVMLKNKGKVISAAKKDVKKTVYVPMHYIEPATGFGGFQGPPPGGGFGAQLSQASIVLDFGGAEILGKYFNVITDEIRQGADKNNLKESDIVRRTDFKGVDFALVSASGPQAGGGSGRADLDNSDGKIDNGYYPISLQYRKYYADPAVVRPYPMGIDADEEVKWIDAGGEPGRSRYYGGKTVSGNESDLSFILDTKKRAGNIPVVLFLSVSNPMCFYEFEKKVDAILVGFSISNNAVLEVISGKYEPQGLLPMQMPANMETVEKQFEDVPFDMKCHVDTEGNAYDYAFGMNWSGVIHDRRVATYKNKTERHKQ